MRPLPIDKLGNDSLLIKYDGFVRENWKVVLLREPTATYCQYPPVELNVKLTLLPAPFEVITGEALLSFRRNFSVSPVIRLLERLTLIIAIAPTVLLLVVRIGDNS